MNQDIEILRILAKYDKEIEKLYNKFLYQLSKVSLNITKIREGAFFSFDDYPEIKEKVNEVLNSYTKEQQDIILSGINTAIVKSFKANEAKFGEFSRYTNQAIIEMRNAAKNAFIESRMKPEQGLSLSQKVWNYTQQGKAEFEAGMSEILEEGLLSGTSAEELGRKLRSKLKHPDMVYKRYHLKKMTAQGKKDVVEWRRKVVDSEGKVRYVKEDLEKVGRGVYRSSRKNALRLAATEINMAYRYADYVRWNSEPFVVGFRIQLSENHTLNGKPFYDMCDELVGVYPKTFKWAGWHPRCRCIATSILVSREEMEKISDLPDDEYRNYRSPNLVKKMPKAYDEYVKKEKDRILASMDRGTSPYWVLDNYKQGDIRKKFVWERVGKTKFKTQAQKDAIQKAWDERRRKNAILAAAEKRHAKRDAVAIQEAWDLRKEKYSKLIKTAKNVSVAAHGNSWVDSTNLNWLINKKKYHLLEAEYRKVAKELSLANKRKKQLSTLIPDVDKWSQQFDYEELKAVFDSVEKKLASWENLSLAGKQKKLTFEVVDYLGGNMFGVQQKYPTWKVSQSAYAKELEKVNIAIYKDSVKKEVAGFVDWTSMHPKATGVHKKVMTLIDMLQDDDFDTKLFKQKLGDVKSHIKSLDKASAATAAKKAARNGTPIDDNDVFSKQRKNNALWFKNDANPKEAWNDADRYMSQYAEEAWAKWNDEQKHVGYLYTSGSRYINEPLFGTYYSVKKSPIDGSIRNSWTDINTLTDMIENAPRMRNDIWVQHGEDTQAFMGKFGIDLRSLSKNDLKGLIGLEGENQPFTSCGSSKGSGFASEEVIMNIYCPKGTKFIYTEPYSHYGDNIYQERGVKWDGTSRQKQGYSSSYENEIILQRGSVFRITKAEKKGYRWYIDVELIEQPTKQPNVI